MDKPVTATLQTAAEIQTEHASKYLQQLCKHFAHRRPVTFDPKSGEIDFSTGQCRLAAEETVLRITLTAPDAAHMEQLEDVVVRHLVRFAFRETLEIAWRKV
jgi:uncharacterized protein